MAATWTPLGDRSVRSVQALTEAPPAPTDASEGVGMVIDFVGAVAVWLDAGDGYTITADAGQVDILFHDAGLWGFAPELSLPVPPGSAGKRRVLLGSGSLNLGSQVGTSRLPLANFTDDDATANRCLLSGGAGGEPVWGACPGGGAPTTAGYWTTVADAGLSVEVSSLGAGGLAFGSISVTIIAGE